jgi:ribosomal protein S30
MTDGGLKLAEQNGLSLDAYRFDTLDFFYALAGRAKDHGGGLMPDDRADPRKQVTLIPTDRIRVLNPRVRNRRTFEEMVENIARIGLKRPITVAPRAGTDPQEYDLVCGQGGSRPSSS